MRATVVPDIGAVRPVKPAAGRIHPTARVEEEDAVVFLERVLAVLLGVKAQRLGQKGRLLLRARATPGGILHPLLRRLDPSDEFPFDLERPVAQFLVVVIHAAVDFLASSILSCIGAQAEHRLFPVAVLDLFVVLHIRILDPENGELVSGLAPRAGNPVIPPAGPSAAALPPYGLGHKEDFRIYLLAAAGVCHLHAIAGLLVGDRPAKGVLGLGGSAVDGEDHVAHLDASLFTRSVRGHFTHLQPAHARIANGQAHRHAGRTKGHRPAGGLERGRRYDRTGPAANCHLHLVARELAAEDVANL